MMHVPDWYTHSVSRETLETLSEYTALLKRWTGRINLISERTLDDIWGRHVWDCAQVFSPEAGKYVDFGSGAGLPGVVVAILRKGAGIDCECVLMESDQRKAVFLRACAQRLNLNIRIVTQRIESARSERAALLSARALARLDKLLGLAKIHTLSSGTCFFLKGSSWREEIRAAEKKWRFSCDICSSKTNPESAILKIRNIERV